MEPKVIQKGIEKMMKAAGGFGGVLVRFQDFQERLWKTRTGLPHADFRSRKWQEVSHIDIFSYHHILQSNNNALRPPYATSAVADIYQYITSVAILAQARLCRSGECSFWPQLCSLSAWQCASLQSEHRSLFISSQHFICRRTLHQLLLLSRQHSQRKLQSVGLC